MKFACQKLARYYAKVTSMTGMVLISAHILDPFQKLSLFIMWVMWMDLNPEDKTSYTTQHQEAFLMYVENLDCTKHRWLSIIEYKIIPTNILFPSTIASASGQSSFVPYDWSSNNKEYIKPQNVAEITTSQCDCAVHLAIAGRLHLYSPHRSPNNWGQLKQNLNDYHSDPMLISSTVWIPDITKWRPIQEETHSKHADVANVARDILCIMSHDVRVVSCFSIGW